MHLLVNYAAVLLLTGINAVPAAENCTLANVYGVASCTIALNHWSFSPEAQANIPDISQVTDATLASLCQVSREIVACIKEVSGPCTKGSMADLQEAMVKGQPLLEDTCKRPDFGNNLRTLLRCVSKLNQTEGIKTLACAHKATNQFLTNSTKGDDGDTDIIKTFCCNAKAFLECSGNEVADNCDQEAQQKLSKIRDTLFETFQCNGPRGANCPAWSPGLPDARDVQWNMLSLTTTDEMRALMASAGIQF
ncbi:uncharacterized protein LOC129597101 [Paramacrobiotus metropolitanus]|uniref:uncharacterized protein LOC129597101 n=1 Tax=Paramacrobiotus metropolitanus TaxID=2943436 RepID=UPI00244610AF|nr:uncharacterized protein LOC129597101 [Paramacrobiotus metropolitanus]